MAHQVSVQRELVVQDLVGLDLNVRGLPLGAPQRLVDHDAGVGQAVALALHAMVRGGSRVGSGRGEGEKEGRLQRAQDQERKQPLWRLCP